MLEMNFLTLHLFYLFFQHFCFEHLSCHSFTRHLPDMSIQSSTYFCIGLTLKFCFDWFWSNNILVRILSKEETLFEFFNSQTIGITLFNGHELLGNTEIELGKISFEEQVSRHFFKLPSPNDIVPFGGDEVSPFLEITAWLKRSTDTRQAFVY